MPFKLVFFHQFSEMHFERASIGSCQNHCFMHRHASVLFGVFQDPKRKRGQFGKHEVFTLDLFFQTPHLLLKRTQKKHEPRLSVGSLAANGLLCPAQGGAYFLPFSIMPLWK